MIVLGYYFGDDTDGIPTVFRKDGSPLASLSQMSAEAWNILVLGVLYEQMRPDESSDLKSTTDRSA